MTSVEAMENVPLILQDHLCTELNIASIATLRYGEEGLEAMTMNAIGIVMQPD